MNKARLTALAEALLEPHREAVVSRSKSPALVAREVSGAFAASLRAELRRLAAEMGGVSANDRRAADYRVSVQLWDMTDGVGEKAFDRRLGVVKGLSDAMTEGLAAALDSGCFTGQPDALHRALVRQKIRSVRSRLSQNGGAASWRIRFVESRTPWLLVVKIVREGPRP